MLNRQSYGAFLKILHSLSFTVMSIIMLEYSKNMPSIQVLFFRALIGTLLLSLILLSLKKAIFFNLSKRSLVFYLSRAAISTVSLLLWIKALENIGVNESMVLGFITPVWLMLFAIFTCKEKFTIKSVIVLVLNSLGVTIVYQPTMDKITLLGLIAALGTTILWAIYDVICKKQAKTDDVLMQAFYVHFFIFLLCLPLAIYWWKPIQVMDLVGLSLISIVGLLNIILVFVCYKFASIVYLIPFSYSRVLFAIMFSYIIYNKLPTYNCIIGAMIIFTAKGYYYAFENKLDMCLEKSRV